VTPPDLAVKAPSRAQRAELRSYPGRPLDPYVGELFERVAADETEFLGADAERMRGVPVRQAR